MSSRRMVRARLEVKSTHQLRISNYRQYQERLKNRPTWAEEYMQRVSPTGTLAARCLDGRFWMCLRAGFKPMRDADWDWWCRLRWTDQHWFFEQQMIWRRLERKLERKRDPDRILNRRIDKRGDSCG